MDPEERRQLTALMVRLADGERAVFRQVFSMTWPLVRGLAQRMLDDPEDADEVAQQALMKLFSRAGEFDPSREALPWILGITAWECRTRRRWRSRRRESACPSPPEQADCARDPEEAAIEAELMAALVALVGTLRPADRETLLAAAGLAERPAVDAPTFRKRLQRARQRLRQAWRERHGVG